MKRPRIATVAARTNVMRRVATHCARTTRTRRKRADAARTVPVPTGTPMSTRSHQKLCEGSNPPGPTPVEKLPSVLMSSNGEVRSTGAAVTKGIPSAIAA